MLAAFLGLVALGGSNAVAIRWGMGDLPPLWAATLRFGLAAALLALLAVARHARLPRGRELLGAAVFGVLTFGAGYALMYLALVDVPAGSAMIVFAIIPLLTLLLAVVHRLEILSLRGIVGAVIAVVGVAIAFGLGGSGSIPLLSLGLLLLSALLAAESSVLVKLIPPGDPIGANLVGMTIGTLILGGLSMLAGETPALPQRPEAWATVVYLAVVGSIGQFLVFLWLLSRWTASGTSYAVLLMPIWTMVAAALLLDEPIVPAAVGGGAIVILGTWLGAFGPSPRARAVGGRRSRGTAVPDRDQAAAPPQPPGRT